MCDECKYSNEINENIDSRQDQERAHHENLRLDRNVIEVKSHGIPIIIFIYSTYIS